MFKINRLQKGITLVEILVAMTVSAIVMTMAVSIFLSSKKNYQHTKTVAQNDVKVLNTQELLYNAITNAGLSCKYGTQTQRYINRTTENLNDLNFAVNKSAVRFGDIASIGSYLKYTLPVKSQGLLYQEDSDYVMVKNESLSASLESKPTSYTLNVDNTLEPAANDFLAICNDDEIDIVKATASNNNQIKLAAAPLGDYHRGDYVGKFAVNIFYIADTGEKDKLGHTIEGLFLYTKNGSGLANSQLLISGVSNLKVSFANTYRNKLRWKQIYNTTDLEDGDSSALRITFKIKGKKFEKVILLK
ncbi:prepilin-type N-terminal cleavage/methylation domain-containing protein [Francisella sp. Scap27]|uniref:PilW family protein n=1 Tax=Francisella sp. Scap27 TaxID=2589986 RepID=UPI0015C039D0|nr:prepilin-type N-terminal cleavage/methylation domain-containing protein [Francisella sp. Scap27]QLE79846.1 prepilin-type N-terminal cleavage/methylation domain-containing protein [Francisella sp. Scap27]